jgi:hypothetical protein
MAKSALAIPIRVVLLVAILLSISFFAPVQATRIGSLAGVVTFKNSPPKPFCLGISQVIVVSYRVDYSTKGAALPPPNATGNVFVTSTLLGTKGEAKAKFPSGVVSINYTASKVGAETLYAVLNYGDFDPIRSTPLKFTVEECQYSFSISAQAVVETTYGNADEIYQGEGALKVDGDGKISGTIPIHWSFTLKSDESNPLGCFLTPQPKLDSMNMHISGKVVTNDWLITTTKTLKLEFWYDDLKMPSANVICKGSDVKVPFSIPSVNPVIALRKAWDADGGGSDTETDGFGPGKVIFTISPITQSSK